MKQHTKDRWEEFEAVNPEPSPRRPQQRTRWASPPMDVYKINYDGAVFSEVNKSGIGVVIRDSSGQVIAALVQQLSQAYQPVKFVAMATCKALEFGNEIGMIERLWRETPIQLWRLWGNWIRGCLPMAF